MTHSHEWIDITRFGDQKKRLICDCGATARQTFGPVNVSTPEDKADLVTVVMWNDGSGRVRRVPVPMIVRTFEPIELA